MQPNMFRPSVVMWWPSLIPVNIQLYPQARDSMLWNATQRLAGSWRWNLARATTCVSILLSHIDLPFQSLHAKQHDTIFMIRYYWWVKMCQVGFIDPRELLLQKNTVQWHAWSPINVIRHTWHLRKLAVVKGEFCHGESSVLIQLCQPVLVTMDC